MPFLSHGLTAHDVHAFDPRAAPNSGLRSAPAVMELLRPGTCRMPGCCLHITGWCNSVTDLKGAEKATDLLVLQGRLFDFGNNKPRDQPVNVAVASGVPCGVAARRGIPSYIISAPPPHCPCCAVHCKTCKVDIWDFLTSSLSEGEGSVARASANMASE